MFNKIVINENQLKNIIKTLVLEQKVNINPKNLKFGDRGNDVSELQSKLIQLGLLKIKKPTGYFGKLTNAALNNYQNPKMAKTQQKKYAFSPRIDQELNFIKNINFSLIILQ